MENDTPKDEFSFGQAIGQTFGPASIEFDGQNDYPSDVPKSARRVLGCLGIATILVVILVSIAVPVAYLLIRNEIVKLRQMISAEADRKAAETKRRIEGGSAPFETEDEQFSRVQDGQGLEEPESEEEIRARLAQEEKERLASESWKGEYEKYEDAMAVLTNRLWFERLRNNPVYLLPNHGETGSGLSWRVHILPLLGFKELYDRFKLDEPWDSTHNKKLLGEAPDVYVCSPEGKTRIRSIQNVDGNGWPFVKFDDFTDAWRETIAVFCASPNHAIEWTKPDDLEELAQSKEIGDLFSLGKSVGAFGRAIFCNFHNYELADSSTPEHLIVLSSINGGEIIVQSDSSYPAFEVESVLRTKHLSRKRVPETEEALAKERMISIGKAFQEYRSAVARDPGSVIQPQGNGLSWRVYLLPYLGETELFKKFDLTKSWNSPENLHLLAEIPPIYQLGCPPGKTRFLIPATSDDKSSPLHAIAKADENASCPNARLFFTGPHLVMNWTGPDADLVIGESFYIGMGWFGSQSVMACTTTGKFLLLPPKLHPTKISALTRSTSAGEWDVEKAFANPEEILGYTTKSEPPDAIKGVVDLPKVSPVGLSAATEETASLSDMERLEKLANVILAFERSHGGSPLFVSEAGKTIPLGDTETKASKLSWRVHLLPYLGEHRLYDQFALGEPWDSVTNLAAAAKMPEVYGDPATSDGKTNICALIGKGTMLSTNSWRTDCWDGIANTIMLIRVGKDRRVPWAKPEDIEINESLQLSELFGADPYLLVSTGAGGVIPIPATFPPSIFTALATARGGELIDGLTVRRLSLHQLGFPTASVQTEIGENAKKLKLASMAMKSAKERNGVYPPGVVRHNPIEPLPAENISLSWRVHILPFIGHEKLYRQFRLKEAWDSPHNQQLIQYMPDIYRDESDAADSVKTRMQIVVGKGTAFPEPGVGAKLEPRDPEQLKTLQILIAPPSKAVPWTQPKDYDVDLENADFSDLRGQEGLIFVNFNHQVYRLKSSFLTGEMKGLLTANSFDRIYWTKLESLD